MRVGLFIISLIAFFYVISTFSTVNATLSLSDITDTPDKLEFRVASTGLSYLKTFFDGIFTCNRVDGCLATDVFRLSLLDSQGVPGHVYVKFFNADGSDYIPAIDTGIVNPPVVNNSIQILDFELNYPNSLAQGTTVFFTGFIQWTSLPRLPFGPVNYIAEMGAQTQPTQVTAHNWFVEKAASTHSNSLLRRLYSDNSTTVQADGTLALSSTLQEVAPFEQQVRFRIQNMIATASNFILVPIGGAFLPHRKTMSSPSCRVNNIEMVTTSHPFPLNASDGQQTVMSYLHLELPESFQSKAFRFETNVDLLVSCWGIPVLSHHVNSGFMLQFIDPTVTAPSLWFKQPQYTIFNFDSYQDTTNKLLAQSTIYPQWLSYKSSGIVPQRATSRTRFFSTYSYAINLVTQNYTELITSGGKNIKINIQMQNVRGINILNNRAYYYIGTDAPGIQRDGIPDVGLYGFMSEKKATDENTVGQSIFYFNPFKFTLPTTSKGLSQPEQLYEQEYYQQQQQQQGHRLSSLLTATESTESSLGYALDLSLSDLPYNQTASPILYLDILLEHLIVPPITEYVDPLFIMTFEQPLPQLLPIDSPSSLSSSSSAVSSSSSSPSSSLSLTAPSTKTYKWEVAAILSNFTQPTNSLADIFFNTSYWNVKDTNAPYRWNMTIRNVRSPLTSLSLGNVVTPYDWSGNAATCTINGESVIPLVGDYSHRATATFAHYKQLLFPFTFATQQTYFISCPDLALNKSYTSQHYPGSQIQDLTEIPIQITGYTDDTYSNGVFFVYIAKLPYTISWALYIIAIVFLIVVALCILTGVVSIVFSCIQRRRRSQDVKNMYEVGLLQQEDDFDTYTLN